MTVLVQKVRRILTTKIILFCTTLLISLCKCVKNNEILITLLLPVSFRLNLNSLALVFLGRVFIRNDFGKKALGNEAIMIEYIRLMMAKHPDLCCVFLCCVGTFLLSKSFSHSKPSITQPQPWPTSFLPHFSTTIDFPYGDLDPLEDIVQQHEVAFIMFYAPWCAKSRELRWQFEQAAKFIGNKVKFISINCWWPAGQCRHRYSFYSYPHLYVKLQLLELFTYQGIPAAEHIVAFLDSFLRPMTYIASHTQLVEFLTKADTTVVGYFNMSSSNTSDYNQFYYASLRILANDPYNNIPFGVITSRHIASVYKVITSSPTIMLSRSIKDTLVYPGNSNFTTSEIVKWIFKHKQENIVEWIVHSGMKTLNLNKHIKQGPTVILFTAIDPIAGPNLYSNILREVALDYFNCDNKDKVDEIIKNSIYMRWRSIQSKSKQRSNCTKFWSSQETEQDKKCCLSVVVHDFQQQSQKHNVCDVCISNLMNRYEHCGFGIPLSSLSLNPAKLRPTNTHYCQNMVINYNTLSRISACCGSHETDDIMTHLGRPVDLYVKTGHQKHVQHMCNILRLNRLQGYQNTINHKLSSLKQEKFGDFTGLGCRTNKTVNFIAMDLKYHKVFATRLGVGKEGSLVLVDDRNEANYIMKKEFIKNNIVKFISNFTNNELRPDLRSSSSSTLSGSIAGKHQLISEVTTDSFQDIVLHKSKDVVLYYYTSWCGFCTAFSHTFLAVARYFQDEHNVVFARINADKNDLPWQYKGSSFPSIVIFPANRKSYSSTYPDDLPKTIPNLVNFVLRHAQKAVKMKAGLKMCSKNCISRNRQSALKLIMYLQKELVGLKSKAQDLEKYIEKLKVKVKLKEGRRDVEKETCSVVNLLKSKVEMLMGYLLVLRTRINRKTTHVQSAKMLRMRLLGNVGQIEKKDMAAILDHHERHVTQKLKKMTMLKL